MPKIGALTKASIVEAVVETTGYRRQPRQGLEGFSAFAGNS